MVPACGGNWAFLCAWNTGPRKSLGSAVCLLITATCALNSAPNKGGDLFSSLSERRCAGRATQFYSSRCDGDTGEISIWERAHAHALVYSVIATPLGHWFLWCSVMKQCWDINYVLTSRQAMTSDSFTTCYVYTVIQQACYAFAFILLFRWASHFGSQIFWPPFNTASFVAINIKYQGENQIWQ